MSGDELFVNQCAIRGRMPLEVRAVEGMPVLKGSVDVPTVSFTLRTDPVPQTFRGWFGNGMGTIPLIVSAWRSG